MLEYREGGEPAIRIAVGGHLDDGRYQQHSGYFAFLERRNHLQREPEVAELIDVASPLLQRFDADLLLSGPGHAPVYRLLNLLLSPQPTGEDFANAAAFALDLPVDRRDLWANLLLNHLAACRDAATPVVLEFDPHRRDRWVEGGAGSFGEPAPHCRSGGRDPVAQVCGCDD
jgi:hypothetical protein